MSAACLNLSAEENCTDNSTDMGLNNAERITSDDAIWILTSTFVIFTMQSGFGLLESGSVSIKNELNIMVKNTVDVVFGGLTFWAVGYGLVYGDHAASNGFTSFGSLFLDSSGNFSSEYSATELSKFFFQASFSTTASTIVSGAMAERTKLISYILFSMVNTFIFVFPAHWVWDDLGFLKKWGILDFAGAGPVHLVGGTTGLIATIMLKPRLDRFSKSRAPEMSSPTNALLGMFMLWWGWLGFNCGSTFGITGHKWKLAARSAVSTINASVGGGMVALLLSYVHNRCVFSVPCLINGVLGALVSITGYCGLAEPWEGMVIGIVGGVIVFYGDRLLVDLKIDDPVGCIPVHGFCGVWGLICIGLFAKPDEIGQMHDRWGLLYAGHTYLLALQTFSACIIIIWSVVISTIFLGAIHLTIGLRVSEREERLGADLVEHDYNHVQQGRGQALTYQMLVQLEELKESTGLDVAGSPEIAAKLREIQEQLRPAACDQNGHANGNGHVAHAEGNGHAASADEPVRKKRRLHLPWKRTMNMKSFTVI